MGCPELADQEDVVAEERHDADGARMLDHLAGVAPAGGVLDGVDAEGDEAAPVQHAPLDRGLDEMFVAHRPSIRRRLVGGASPHIPS